MSADAFLGMVTLGTLLAAIPVYFAIAWGTKWIPKRWARVYARVVLVPPFAVVLGAVLSIVSPFAYDDGDWRCLVCAAEEHQVSYAGIVIRREPEVSTRAYPEFERWFRQEIGAAHEHDWISVGCHRRGKMIACSFGGMYGGSFYGALPRIPSPRLARSLALELAEASSSARRRLIVAGNDDPFRAIAQGTVMSADEFEKAYATWLDEHPEWK